MSGEQLNRILNEPAVRAELIKPRNIVRDFDMPYLGGYSRSGDNIYLDRHLPETVWLQCDGQKKDIRPAEFLAEFMGHEPVEISVMNGAGWEYGPAHSGPATGSERRKLLMRLGPGWWAPYQEKMLEYVKVDEHEKLQVMPKDYDLRPILYPPLNEGLLAAVKRAMGDTKKFAKAEVAYTNDGRPSEHCGPIVGWSGKNDCANFIYPSACEIVTGKISPRGWCKKWERAST